MKGIRKVNHIVIVKTPLPFTRAHYFLRWPAKELSNIASESDCENLTARSLIQPKFPSELNTEIRACSKLFGLSSIG